MPYWRALSIPIRAPACAKKITEVGFNNFGRLEFWEDIRIAISPHGAAEPGQTIADIAKAQNCDELDAVFDIIIADKGSTCILVRYMSEDDVSNDNSRSNGNRRLGWALCLALRRDGAGAIMARSIV